MELILLAIPALILLGVWLLRGSKDFEAPKVSPISPESLKAFERAPSLWVNRSEATFFAVLRRHLPPSHHIHGKVRLEDIIRVRRDVPSKLRWSLRGRVKSRHVDYLITDSTGRPVLAIELDGAAHNRRHPSEADRVKTALFAASGLKLLRVASGDNYDHIAATIASDLRDS